MSGKHLNILIVEDSEDDAQLLLRELKRGGYEVESERVETAETMQAALAGKTWDLVLSDFSMPQFSAPQALAILQASGLDLPFIIVSGTIGEDTAVAALKAGAHDFLIKGNFARLSPAIERELKDAKVRVQQKRAEEALRESEQRFRSLFENTPVAIWEEDFSEVKAYLDKLKDTGVVDLETYLADHLETVLECVELVKVLDVNQATLNLFGANGKTELLGGIGKTFTEESIHTFKQELIAIANDVHELEFDVPVKTLAGQIRDTTLKWATAPNNGEMKSRVLVSFVDITERKQHERELEAIASTSTALRAAQTQDEILTHLLNKILDLLQAESGSIWLNHPLTDEVYLVHGKGLSATSELATKSGKEIASLSLRTGDVIISHELQKDPRIPEPIRSDIPEGYGGAAVPFYTADKVDGAIMVNTKLPRELSVNDLRVLSALAEIGGNAIHRARLYDENTQRLHRLDTLRTIDIAISSSLDLRVTLKIILEKTVQELKVDAASVLLITPGTGRLEFAAEHGFRTQAIKSSSFQLGEDYPGQAAYERRIIHIKDLHANKETFSRRDLIKDENFVTYMGVPLIAKGAVKGVLEIFHRSPLKIEPQWLNFLDALSGQTGIAVDNIMMFDGLQRSNLDLALAYDNTLEGWSRALDLRDKETEGHTKRVTEMTVRLTRKMGINEAELIHIRRGALLHDIGKMGIPDSILLKPDKLTPEEWEIMRRHPQYAYDLLSPITFLHSSLDIPFCHHEKWDGTGYPRALKGEQIPLSARIFAIVDVWDALRNDRPYRAGWEKERAMEYIKEQNGKHFDPQVVQAFTEMVENE